MSSNKFLSITPSYNFIILGFNYFKISPSVGKFKFKLEMNGGKGDGGQVACLLALC